MHTDEAVQAALLGDILAGQGYHYGPQGVGGLAVDLHGPAPLVVDAPIAWLSGARDMAGLDERMVRLGPVLTGAAAVLLFGLLCRSLGTLAAAGGAVVWSVASLPVFYSRYFIHETLFVAATLGLVVCASRAVSRGMGGWAIAAGFSAGVMLGCKETAAISFAAMTLGALPWGISIVLRGEGRRVFRTALPAALTAFVVFVAVVLALYSWGGTNWRGPLDLIGSYTRYAGRAAGQEGHQKPFWYYAVMIGLNPASLLLLPFALVGGVVAFLTPAPMARFFGFYGLLVFGVYSAIPYKTPWLALNFWMPFCVLAGCGFAQLCRAATAPASRWLLVVAALLVPAMLGRETWRRVFADPCGERNPYAYSHTGEDMFRLPVRMAQLARMSGRGGKLRIAVLAADPWPLPWYLRAYSQTGYWQPGQNPAAADLFITSTETWQSLGDRIKGWRPEYFGMRPEVLAILWTPPEKDGQLQWEPRK